MGVPWFLVRLYWLALVTWVCCLFFVGCLKDVGFWGLVVRWDL